MQHSQRSFLGCKVESPPRIQHILRRNGPAPLQSTATIDNYVADVPVAGEKVRSDMSSNLLTKLLTANTLKTKACLHGVSVCGKLHSIHVSRRAFT